MNGRNLSLSLSLFVWTGLASVQPFSNEVNVFFFPCRVVTGYAIVMVWIWFGFWVPICCIMISTGIWLY